MIGFLLFQLLASCTCILGSATQVMLQGIVNLSAILPALDQYGIITSVIQAR